MALVSNSSASEFLLKQFLNFPTNKPGQLYSNEFEMNYSNYVLQEDVFIEGIPDLPDISNTVPPTEYGLTSTDYTAYGVDICMGTVEYFDKLVLEKVESSRTPFSWYRTDQSGNSLLRNALQFNYKAVGTNFPYNYKLFANGTEISRGDTRYRWIFDVKSGYITFFETGLPSQITTLELSFYRYIGQKGLSGISDILTNSDTNTSKVVDYLTKQPPVFTDNSANTSYTQGVLDIHWFKGDEYDISFRLTTSGIILPRLDRIHIDVSSSVDPTETVRFATIAPDISNYQFYYGDTSGSILLNEANTYTIHVYGENQANDTSYNTLSYVDICFQLVDGDFPATAPVITSGGSIPRVDSSTIETIRINGIPSIRKFSVIDLSFTIDPISTAYRMDSRSPTAYADLTLHDTIAYQPQISEDICGGVGVRQFTAQEGDGSANFVLDVSDIYFGQSVYEPDRVSVFSLSAVNIQGTSQLDLSFERNGGSITTWWVDASSVELDGSGALTSTLIQEGRDTYDICLTEITRNDQDVSIVDISMWEYERVDASAIHGHQLLFLEGRFCGAGYQSPLLGNTEVYRDWAEIGGPDYTDISNQGIPDVIRERGYNNTSPLYKWCAKRFTLVTDASGRFRTIRIDGKLEDEWPDSWRVYALQFLYGTDNTESAFVDRTSWMDTRRFLSSRTSETPYTPTSIDGFGCAYSSQIALKLNPRKDHLSIVYILVGIPNSAPHTESFFTKLELI